MTISEVRMSDAGLASLRCEGLNKSFDGTCALRDVHLEFPSSGIVAIIGPNGAGKTTMLNVITGCFRADAGRVFLGEWELTRLAPHRIARLGIARTFQDLRLITLVPVLENVMLARQSQKGERLWHALFRFGVAAQEARNREEALRWLRFVGLGETEHEAAGELSYGQQKLLTLACCLATESRILLLDEPVAGVHPNMIDKILGLLRELKGMGKLVVFVEHDIAAVRQVADQVVVMDEGRIIAHGQPKEVLERPEIMEAYVG
jgi:ABC-type branched-subunit amino acid transport system ATPase component